MSLLPFIKTSQGIQTTSCKYGFFIHIILSCTPNLGCSCGAWITLDNVVSFLYPPRINCMRLIPLSTRERRFTPSLADVIAAMSPLSSSSAESCGDSELVWSASASSTRSSVLSRSHWDTRLAADRNSTNLSVGSNSPLGSSRTSALM